RPIGSYANQITPAEIAMAEKALHLWEDGAQGYLHFVRNTAAPLTDIINIGVGDLAALGYTSSPRGVIGLGGGSFDQATHTIHSGLAWLDVAEFWENTFNNGNLSGSFDSFTVFAHEIGHALGFGHTDGLGGRNIMDGTYAGEKTALSVNDLALVQAAYAGGVVIVIGTGPTQADGTLGVHTVTVALGQAVPDMNFGNRQVGAPTAADLPITKSHPGNFHQGDVGDPYTITVSNVGTAATAGTVSVADVLPAGLTATAIAGAGWTVDLSTLTATRSDPLAP